MDNGTIEIRHNGMSVKITARDGKLFFSTAGMPTNEILQAIQQIKSSGCNLKTATQLLIPIMFK